MAYDSIWIKDNFEWNFDIFDTIVSGINIIQHS